MPALVSNLELPLAIKFELLLEESVAFVVETFVTDFLSRSCFVAPLKNEYFQICWIVI